MTRDMIDTLEQLTRKSVDKHFYPLGDVAWDAHPITDDAWYMPPEAVSLYGTPAWDAMDERQRKRLSLHEFVNACGLALWFENCLMRTFLDRLYVMAPDEPHFRYMLVEVGEEVQHNLLFGEFIRRSGIGWYPARWPMRFAGRWIFPLEARLNRAWLITAVMIGEEVIEGVNRATLAANVALHPLAAEVARIHRIEEARHLSYARTYLETHFAEQPAWKRSFIRMAAPFVAWGMGVELARGAVYRAVGLPHPARLFWAARRNPHHRAFIRDICSRLEAFFADVGIITPAHRRRWVRLGLLSAATPARG